MASLVTLPLQELDQENKLAKKMSEWKAPKAVAQGGGEVNIKVVNW